MAERVWQNKISRDMVDATLIAGNLAFPYVVQEEVPKTATKVRETGLKLLDHANQLGDTALGVQVIEGRSSETVTKMRAKQSVARKLGNTLMMAVNPNWNT